MVGEDLRRRGEHVRGLHLTVHQGFQRDRAGLIECVEALEHHPVAFPQPGLSVGAGLELGRGAEDHAPRERLELRYRARWYRLANAWVTVTESLSWADDGLRISSDAGSVALSCASTWAVVAAVLDGSTAVVSRAPLSSGMIVMAPFSISG